MQPRIRFCVYFQSGWLCGQLDWEFGWLETAPLLAESVFSRSRLSNLMHCVAHPHSEEGKGQVGGGKGKTSPFEGNMHLDKLKATACLEPKITAEWQLEYRWESISSKNQHSVFSSF